MNILDGTILEIKTEGSLSLVKVMAHTCVITSLLIDTPTRSHYLKEGNSVNVVFKETEVILAKNLEGSISVQNQLICSVQQVEKGELLCKITMDFKGAKIVSVITRNAFDQLKITEPEEVLALIKSTEISLAPND